MFDTSLVRAQAADPARRASLLAISIALHSAIAIGAIAAGIASVDFPSVAPDQLEIYRPVSLPAMPIGTPDGKKGEEPQKQPPKQEGPKAAPAVITEPVEIPKEVPVPIADPIDTTASGSASGGEATGTGSGPFGDSNGEPGGTGVIPGGTGLGDGTGPLVPGGEVKSAKVIRRVEPQYPRAMVPLRFRDAIVVVRCVIDKEGRIRNPEIISTSHVGFNNAVLDAVRQWAFEPGSYRGERVDTWFELTVTFRMR